MLRTVKIYIGNAAKFDPENLHEFPGFTVNEDGEIFNPSGERINEIKKYGYKLIPLEINGKNKWCKVHRIVACTFPDICGEFNEVVNHLDEDKTNNKASNLRWTTQDSNMSWGTINERRRKTIQENREIRNIVKLYYSQNGLLYSKDIKLTRLKHLFKVNDKRNGIVLYVKKGTNEVLTEYE